MNTLVDTFPIYFVLQLPRIALENVVSKKKKKKNIRQLSDQNKYFIFSGTNDMNLSSKPIKMTHKITKDEPKTEDGSGISAIQKA
mgnify:CR=1 FL=1